MGIIDEVGAGVTLYKKGDRVVMFVDADSSSLISADNDYKGLSMSPVDAARTARLARPLSAL